MFALVLEYSIGGFTLHANRLVVCTVALPALHAAYGLLITLYGNEAFCGAQSD
jgi:hypothetical protein